MLEVVDSGSWWGLIHPLFHVEIPVMSGSYDLMCRFIAFFISPSLMMVALHPMLAYRGSSNSQLDIFEKLDDTKGVAKVSAGIITTTNATIDQITKNSKHKGLSTLVPLSSTLTL